MAIVIINESKGVVMDFGGEAEGIFHLAFARERMIGGGSGARGSGGAEGSVGVVDDVFLDVHEVGDIFVAVVEVASNIVGGGEEDQRACGDRLCGIPHVGVEEGVVGAPELLDAEVIVVGEALEKVGIGRLSAHFDTAAHAVKGHGDHGVARLPANGAVFGVVDDRPNTCLGLDEGLIAIVVVLWREVIDGGVLVEIVGGVGLAFGCRAISDIVVGIGKVVCGNQFIADVVAVVLVIDKHTATAKEGRSPL